MTAGRHVVAFVRAPRLGRVKSRLARDIGPVAAWRFYRLALAAALCRLAGRGRWRLWLAVTPDSAVAEAALAAPGWQRIAQGSGDLGDRMGRVLRRLPPGPAVIVGTDVPDLSADHVALAFRALGDHDAVFGPATDGGFWLVGLRRSPRRPDLFSNVRWSTPHALADTLANSRGLRIALLETLTDVDVGSDLGRVHPRRWQRRQPSGSDLTLGTQASDRSIH